LKTRFNTSQRTELFLWTKERLQHDVWEEYTRDDLAHYIAEQWEVSYRYGVNTVDAVEFIQDIENDIRKRKQEGTLCDCIPLLSPYNAMASSLAKLSAVKLHSPNRATPYAVWGLTSLLVIRLDDSNLRKTIDFVARYLVLGQSKYIRGMLLSNIKSKRCAICNEKYRELLAPLVTKALYSICRYSNLSSEPIQFHDGLFVKINRD